MDADATALFARVFREELSSNLEYSLDDHSDRYGTMISGGNKFLMQVREFASAFPFASEWEWAVRRFAEHVRPDAYLLRADWKGDNLLAVGVYCRFPYEPSDDTFRHAVNRARPLNWSGPSLQAVGKVLGTDGPRGIAFRVDRSGRYRSSVYFKLGAERTRLGPTACHDLVRVCGFAEDVADMILQDVSNLYPPGPLGVIGLDDGPEGIAGSLKFNPANVFLPRALQFLSSKGIAERAIRRVVHMARLLRARWLSYLGLKYDSGGFIGWRTYYSYETNRLPAAGSFRIVSERSPLPTLRLPHY